MNQRFDPKASIATLFSIVAMVSGCGTPQPVRDQASNTAALTSALEAELREFREVRAIIAKGRVDSVKRQENAISEVEHSDAYNDRTRILAGQTGSFALMDVLRKLADSRRDDDEALAKRIAETEKSLAAATSPLVVPADKLAATQKILLALSEELSRAEWFKFITGFAKEVHKDMKDAKKSAKESLDSAKEAPTQKSKN